MFSHVTVGTNDIERAAAFYDAVLTPLGLRQRAVVPDGGPIARCWVAESHLLPRFYVYEPFDGAAASAGNGAMVAFEAASDVAVDSAYAQGYQPAGLMLGSRGHGCTMAQDIMAHTCAIRTATKYTSFTEEICDEL